MTTNLEIPSDQTIQLTKNHIKRMVFIQNALDQGWTVKKSQDSYIFTKNMRIAVKYSRKII